MTDVKVFSHIKNKLPAMVDIENKLVSVRKATARTIVRLPVELADRFDQDEIHVSKGPVLATAITAGVMAAKKTQELIPFCHQVPLEHVDITFDRQSNTELVVFCTATSTGKTGVEMEALMGASIAALTIIDMCKSISSDIVVQETMLWKKSGGKHDVDRSARS